MTHPIRTTCNRDCPDSCSVLATVEDGRIVKHKGDPEHGVTRGFLCYRGNHYLDRQYSPDRIVYPQRKTEKGWQRISWDDALDRIVEKLTRYKNRLGPTSVGYINYSGIKGLVARLMGKKFWAHFGGATILKGGLSVEAAHAGQDLDFGGPCTHAPEDLRNSAGFVIWGKNVAVTRVHCWPYISEARKRGAKVVVVDPVHCATAAKADTHLAIRPGSDAMLAAGVARLLIEKDAVDKTFIDQSSTGFEEFRSRVLAINMDDVAAATDLAPEQIEELAGMYAATRPLATMIGLGPSYWRCGGATVRMIDALAAMSGNVGIRGGGAHTDINGASGLDLSWFEGLPDSEQRSILLPKLGDEILAAADPPLKMGFVAGANPVATCPDSARVREGIESLEFTVVVDQFMTATAELADLFLPCTTYLEMEDLVTAYGHHWLGLDQPVVPPLGEARSDCEIWQALADRLGFGEHLAGDPKIWIDRFLAPLDGFGITRESLAEHPRLNPLADPVPFADGKFATPTGKYAFITDFTPTGAPDMERRLRLMATKTLKMVNAQINDADLPEEPVVRVHQDTLLGLAIESGEAVVLESAAGRVRARIEADEKVRPDVVLFNPAAWRGDVRGVNQLRESFVSDMGDAAAMHETMVTVRKV